MNTVTSLLLQFVSVVCGFIEDTIQNSVIIDQTYPASSSVQVDLSTLPSGSYYLYIYAYDCWWLGEFELY